MTKDFLKVYYCNPIVYNGINNNIGMDTIIIELDKRIKQLESELMMRAYKELPEFIIKINETHPHE